MDVDEVSYPGRILFWLAHPRGVGYFEVSLVVYLVDKGGVGHFFWLGWPWGGRILEKWVGYFVNIPCRVLDLSQEKNRPRNVCFCKSMPY